MIRLADVFSLFHHAWIAPLGKKSADEGYWLKQRGSPKWRAWSGYAFENACLKHAPRIKADLGIGGVQTTESPWRHAGSDAAPGAQIDLLIDRADGTISVCEMKFSEAPFTIDKSYAAELRQKRDTLRRITGTRKNIFLTMVTTFGIADNPYAKELITSSVLADELFRE